MLSTLLLAALLGAPPASPPAVSPAGEIRLAQKDPTPAEIEREFSGPKAGVHADPPGVLSSGPRTAKSKCPEDCAGSCPFPGECGHKGCACAPKAGWVPPKDEWRPFPGNPAWEVYGRLDDRGVFRYTQSRLRQDLRRRYLVVRVQPVDSLHPEVRIDLERRGDGPGDPLGERKAELVQVRTADPKVLAKFRQGRTVVLTIAAED